MNSYKVMNYLLIESKCDVLNLGKSLSNGIKLEDDKIERLGQKITILVETFYNSNYANNYQKMLDAYNTLKMKVEAEQNIENELATICLELNEIIDAQKSLNPMTK